ncbi:TRAP transporter, DctM-like membrane protein [Isoalcanivorax pacificus W11-5]|uniref:TRAP transporter, DctM-like membrane protein n=1 Tax=Isoalcanivorax pacificus W11-5 TaxID=391936 RepID=A0A0B4XNB5_9GAMM|nr:TRAP transporter large permease subunit [Isoalcanivorax pacificus]AJD48571.1 TRAP transporter, DctM-like membrane protein [Isoalcanivorax pacificus W11-5]
MEATSRFTLANRSIGEWISSLPTLVILLITIFLASGEIIHSQLLKIGENSWQEYFLLRSNPSEPTCQRDRDIDADVARAIAEREAAAANDPLAGLLGTDIDADAVRRSVIRSQEVCQERWDRYEHVASRITPSVEAFRAVETTVAMAVTELGAYKRLLLCLLLLICAATTTVMRHHIALRPMRTVRDHYVSTLAQLGANSILAVSAIVYREREIMSMADGIQVGHFYLHQFWIAGFTLLAAINIWQLVRPPKNMESGGGWGKALLTIPLYSFMALNAGLRFIMDEYYHGISVYLGMIMELSTLFLNLALYIWIGMMLKQTRLAQLVFNVFRPWHMSPELLCFVVLAVTALPTAYTGASGIFVIAAGAVIYAELMRAGARPQMALATTAMSGSMGVVLRPCLVVVIIAALNNAVTTTELFNSGIKVFFFTLFLFFIYSQFARKEPARIAPFGQALPASLKLLKPIIPYVIVLMAVVLFFRFVLDRRLDEFSAPIILPVVLLAILVYEYVLTPRARREAHAEEDLAEGIDRPRNLEQAVRRATNETTGHIGALLILMAMSACVGGIIERSGMMENVPDAFPSIWIAMAMLVATLVFIGMIMDPLGAVILVNATLAQIAFANGIAPLHFWIVTLVAFELGYLTPPVALNHLLTRQVVGDDEVENAKVSHGSFWVRYEKYLLPMAVMFTALILIAFMPLLFDGLHDWLFQKIDVSAQIIPLD